MSYETENTSVQTLNLEVEPSTELGGEVLITLEPFHFVTFKPMGMVDSDDSDDFEDSPEEVKPEL